MLINNLWPQNRLAIQAYVNPLNSAQPIKSKLDDELKCASCGCAHFRKIPTSLSREAQCDVCGQLTIRPAGGVPLPRVKKRPPTLTSCAWCRRRARGRVSRRLCTAFVLRCGARPWGAWGWTPRCAGSPRAACGGR